MCQRIGRERRPRIELSADGKIDRAALDGSGRAIEGDRQWDRSLIGRACRSLDAPVARNAAVPVSTDVRRVSGTSITFVIVRNIARCRATIHARSSRALYFVSGGGIGGGSRTHSVSRGCGQARRWSPNYLAPGRLCLLPNIYFISAGGML